MGSVVLAPEIRQSTACVIFTDQGSGSMHWQADSYSWYHQGNPRSMNFESKFKKGLKIYFRKKCGKNTQNNYTKKNFHDPDNHSGMYDHPPRARHPGMWSQMGLRKHHYEQS